MNHFASYISICLIKEITSIGIIVSLLILGVNSFSIAQNIPSSLTSKQVIENQKDRMARQLAAKGLELGASVFIRIFKESKELEVWIKNDGQFELFRTYEICAYGGMGLGPKTRQGDGRAPEGFYFLTPQQLNPNSNFHLSINLGYPNKYDRIHGRTGNFLMIHGSCVSLGCYAMTDPYIEEIYTLVHYAFLEGQAFIRVHIFPFKMTDLNMTLYEGSDWFEFWKNLQEGYKIFEQKKIIPPNVEVVDGIYIFN